MIKALLDVSMRRVLAALLALAIPMCFDVPGAHGQQPKEAERVHFLLAIDTRDKSAKALGLDLDRDNMKKIIGDSMQACGCQEGPKGKYTITVLDDTRMSEKTVLDHYRKLKVQDNETLVFYYTGHGGFYPEKGHLLAMRNFYDLGGGKQLVKYATVDRKELLVAMARHNPRGIIVLTDCCASSNVPVFSAARIKPPNPDFKAKLKGQGKGEVFRDLFFRTRGVVNITAAMTGTPARGDREKGGSHFTVALANLLRESPQFFADKADNPLDTPLVPKLQLGNEGRVQWSEFFPRLSTLTQLESHRTVQNKQGDRFADFHTPEAFLLGEPILKAKGAVPAGGKTPVLEKDDSLTRNDPTYKKGNNIFFIKNYPMKMVKDRAYLISLHSSQFDTFLFVKDQSGKTLAFNDDYGNTTTRSRILFFPPVTGNYDVGVSSYGPEETGDFSLTIQESTYSDALTKTDSKDRYCLGSFAKNHPVHLKALRSYTIRLESENTNKYGSSGECVC